MACPQPNALDDTSRGDALWQAAKKYRYDCDVLTSLLREQVPVLDFVQWMVHAVEPGFARTVLPLISPSTNQHCTHQAALLFLAADYTGGIALASLIPHWPVIGVHPVSASEKSISLWLVKGEIKYVRPSVGRLEVVAQVEADRHDRVRHRYLQGKPVLETITVFFRNGNVTVAEATMTYFARQSDKLRCDGVAPEKVNVLYQHKLISSAELIAGVRARENGLLFDDPYAALIAGEHGRALAARFCQKSPQLGGMVAARTRHLDLHIVDFARRGGREVILLGSGYDMRPFRLSLPMGMRIFELDFPTVLVEREQRLEACGIREPIGIERIAVPIDLRSMSLASAMRGFVDPSAPIFVAWEGMSMYFDEPEVRSILSGIAPLMSHAQSRLWVDFVDERIVCSPEAYPEVDAFIRGMQLLGEPFVFGPRSIDDFMRSNGFHCHEVVPSGVFFAEQSDPVYSLYHFCAASVASIPAPAPAADASWAVHAPHHPPLPSHDHAQGAAERLSSDGLGTPAG